MCQFTVIGALDYFSVPGKSSSLHTVKKSHQIINTLGTRKPHILGCVEGKQMFGKMLTEISILKCMHAFIQPEPTKDFL